MAAYFGDTLPRTLKAAPYGVVFFVCYELYPVSQTTLIGEITITLPPAW